MRIEEILNIHLQCAFNNFDQPPTAAAQDVSDFRQKVLTRFSLKTLPHYTDKALLSAIHSYLHITVKQILCLSIVQRPCHVPI